MEFPLLALLLAACQPVKAPPTPTALPASATPSGTAMVAPTQAPPPSPSPTDIQPTDSPSPPTPVRTTTVSLTPTQTLPPSPSPTSVQYASAATPLPLDPGERLAFAGLSMVDQNVGWGIDQQGRILRTTDGGKTWALASPPDGTYTW